MCTATGIPASSASPKKRSSAGSTSRSPLGNREITTPRWSWAIAHCSSSTASSMPVVGTIAWANSRPWPPAQKSVIHSL